MAKFDIGNLSKELILKGKIKWAKGLFRADDEYKKWQAQLYPTPDSLEDFRELQSIGLKNVLKKDDDGYHFGISRPTEKFMRGKLVAFTPPLIYDKDNNPITSPIIGNGSDVTVKMELYKYKAPGSKSYSVAVRLAAVRVDNLVPFEKENDFTESEQKQDGTLSQQPAPMF